MICYLVFLKLIVEIFVSNNYEDIKVSNNTFWKILLKNTLSLDTVLIAIKESINFFPCPFTSLAI